MKDKKRILFLTGTRADFGKQQALMQSLYNDSEFEVYIFVTGMHLLAKYGSTYQHIEKLKLGNVFKYINQNPTDGMDIILAKTISGLSDYVHEFQPDLLIIHGDRVEPLAGSIVGTLNGILTAHIEGGEVSGTIDEMIRHSVSKLAHIHFTANAQAVERLLQMGERHENIYEIGSPDLDIIASNTLPSLEKTKQYYNIDFDEYALLIFHPVVSELNRLEKDISIIVEALLETNMKYITIYPNNDAGTNIILNEYEKIKNHPNFKTFPSLRFEHYITLMKNAQFVVGNSSSGVREAPDLGVPSVNLGTRQNNRAFPCDSIIHCEIKRNDISIAITQVLKKDRIIHKNFGNGQSAQKFYKILKSKKFWDTPTQKFFIDRSIITPHHLETTQA